VQTNKYCVKLTFSAWKSKYFGMKAEIAIFPGYVPILKSAMDEGESVHLISRL
jgi:hypothetical protein